MNKNKSKIFEKYKSAEFSVNLQKNPMQIVGTILSELERSMNVVADNIEMSTKKNYDENHTDKKNTHFTRSLVAIYTLQTSLDFDKGGQIATQLFQLYEYCRKQLIKGFSSKVVGGIRKAVACLKEIMLAWEQMVTNEK